MTATRGGQTLRDKSAPVMASARLSIRMGPRIDKVTHHALSTCVVPGVEGADNNDYALVIRRWKNRGHDRSMNSAPLAAGSRQTLSTLSTLSTSSRPR